MPMATSRALPLSTFTRAFPLAKLSFEKAHLASEGPSSPTHPMMAIGTAVGSRFSPELCRTTCLFW